jgi:hypothetical protein
MPTNLAFVKHRLQLRLNGNGVDTTGASDVIVYWVEAAGGQLDEITGAQIGAAETPVSGVLRAFGQEEPARSVLRQYLEIQEGDVILDTDPDGLITLLSPLSGSTTLDAVAAKGVRFQWDGKLYVQAKIGEKLAQKWSVMIADQRLYRTLLLRPAT